MQLFVWNGVQRRNMSPPEPCRPPLTRTHDPVRSGFPLASLGVGAFGSAGGGGPNCAATGVAPRPTTTPRTSASIVAFIALLTLTLLTGGFLHAVRNRYDDVHLADLGDLCLQVANDRAVAALDDRAGVERLDLEQRIVPVLEVAVDELRRVRPVLDDDALRKKTAVERRRRCGPGDSRNRIRHDRLLALPRQRRRRLHAGCCLAIDQDGRVLTERLGQRQAGRGSDGGLRRAVGAGPETDPSLLERVGARCRFAFAGNDLCARNVFVP